MKKPNFGTRIDQLRDLPRQKSVMAHLDDATKAIGENDLRVIYSYLCEMTHPNHLGFARFINGIGDDGVKQTLRRDAKSTINDGMVGIILCALGWSSFVVLDGWKQVSESAQQIGQRWPSEMRHM